MTAPVLGIRHLSKSFPGLLALDDVSLELRPREVLGLVGENGAGKSTLLKVLAGLYPPDAGEVRLRGKPVALGNVAAAAAAGIGMVFQEQSLIPNLSVAENILLGQEQDAIRLGCYRWAELHRRAQAQLDKVGAALAPETRTASLSFAQRQMVELAKVLALEESTHHEPVILLDEPTSVLDGDESEAVLGQIERLRGHAAVIFVSHRLEEVLRVSDRVYVMTNGRCVGERDPRSCSVPELQRLMLGRELSEEYQQSSPGPEGAGASRLVVRDLGLAGSYEDVSFELHEGEVLGIAGVQGSGREMLCRTLFGALAPDRGQLRLDGREVRFGTPADAIAAGIGYVPAERRIEGIVGGLGVRQNMTLARLDQIRRGPFIEIGKERAIVAHWIQRFRIRTPSAETLAGNLSGGNQQKVVLAKWLIGEQTRVLILDHPLRGLDVGAKAEVFAAIRDLAATGLAIILIADTLEELLALSHSILVMRDGRISGYFARTAAEGPTKLRILERML
jgi:ribose transport system ATP-binding protein